MANGTIAFDTLTTSDSVNTNTEKSIDTSYIFNGVSKWWGYKGNDGSSLPDSFNLGSITDIGTGDFRLNFTNVMSNATYVFSCLNNHVPNDASAGGDSIAEINTTDCRVKLYDNGSISDATALLAGHGDLA
tara:strand:- start:29 stop:421 length:393 start_codon:yes stop_codon:yes gene_type:complete